MSPFHETYPTNNLFQFEKDIDFEVDSIHQLGVTESHLFLTGFYSSLVHVSPKVLSIEISILVHEYHSLRTLLTFFVNSHVNRLSIGGHSTPSVC